MASLTEVTVHLMAIHQFIHIQWNQSNISLTIANLLVINSIDIYSQSKQKKITVIWSVPWMPPRSKFHIYLTYMRPFIKRPDQKGMCFRIMEQTASPK